MDAVEAVAPLSGHDRARWDAEHETDFQRAGAPDTHAISVALLSWRDP